MNRRKEQIIERLVVFWEKIMLKSCNIWKYQLQSFKNKGVKGICTVGNDYLEEFCKDR